ncbi:MAG: hypothetical protein L0332_07490 [Chloroflexi bacterium]|nr:hypothetical protein [Chloroflexota bacterium]MCI0575494.1 hypothetical protein [Chloroflexota bacterium]MCI0726552.1 hypothetical protein [Chloroflexota bacterium]
MKRKTMAAILLSLIVYFLLRPGLATAQEAGQVRLHIRLRDSSGAAVAGELVLLQRLPEGAPIACATDANGLCGWTAGRGLYQLLFNRPLDHISALAVAEGGLAGFGVTVGDEPITYHFTFHTDGHVYFDAAPEAAVPEPIIPTLDDAHHDSAAALPETPPAGPAGPVTAGTLTAPGLEATGAETPSSRSWRVLLFIALGLATGGSLHLWARRRPLKPHALHPAKRRSGVVNRIQNLKSFGLRSVRTKSKIQNQECSDA